MARNNRQQESSVPELQERVVYINRVSKVVKGGRRFALTALVVVGDGNGRVGVGMGKSQEVPTAIKKGVEDAKKNMFTVALTPEKTVPHEILGEYGAGRVLIKPAVPGTGVMAGGPVRAIMELAGVQDVITKSLGTSNAMNIVKAAAEGLKGLETPQEVAARRDLSVAEIFGWKVTQVKSAVGRPADQGKTLKALGLGKIGRTVEQVDNESVRGMLFKVKHLVTVEEI